MSQFRILDFNFVFDSTIAITASSEDVDFPVTNLVNHLRPKVWRSSGTFIIDSTNESLDFDEGGGELNATIASATYTPSGLETAIKTALEAAGANVYTITFSTVTGKWTVSSSGGTLSLLWNSGINTATTIGGVIGFDTSVDNTGSTSYIGASIAIHTEESIVFDLQTEEEIDSFAMVFDPEDGIKFSESAVLNLQGNATANFASPAVDVTLSIDQTFSTITHFFTSDQSFRFWRIKIVDPANSDLFVEVSKVFLTSATQLTQGVSIGFIDELRDQSRSVTNNYGHQYFDIFPNRRSFVFNHQALSDTDLQTLFDIYNRVGMVTPVCIALDPEEDVYDKDRFFMYGRFSKPFKGTNIFFTFFDQQIEILEAL